MGSFSLLDIINISFRKKFSSGLWNTDNDIFISQTQLNVYQVEIVFLEVCNLRNLKKCYITYVAQKWLQPLLFVKSLLAVFRTVLWKWKKKNLQY